MAKARGPSRQPTDVGSRRSILMKTIVTVLLALIVMIGLTILIIWITIRPRKPVFTIDSALIHNYNLLKDHHLDASYSFVLRSFNPNKKMSIQYKQMDVTVMFEDETVANGAIDSWHQHKRDRTSIKLDLTSNNVEVSGALSEHLNLAKSSNKVVLSVKLKSKLRSRLGIWRSKYYHLKVSCVNVATLFSTSSNGQQVNFCDVDI